MTIFSFLQSQPKSECCTNKGHQCHRRSLIYTRSSAHFREHPALTFVILLFICWKDVETSDPIRHRPTIALILTEAAEPVPRRQRCVARRILLRTIFPRIQIHTDARIVSWALSVGWARYVLPIQNARVVSRWVVGVVVLDCPVDAVVAIVRKNPAEVASLVYESLRRVAGHEIFEIEAVLHDGDARCGEGQR